MSNFNSKIVLARDIPLDRSYKNVIDKTNDKMLEILYSPEHLVVHAENYSKLPKGSHSNYINTDFSYVQCLKANYIAFQNPDLSNKWFFGWIDDVEYKSPNMTRIYYTIDYHTTWFGYWEQLPCFVVRQIVNDDVIGRYTDDESLAVPEVICRGTVEDSVYKERPWLAVTSNWNPNKKTGYDGISILNHNVFGGMVHLFDTRNYEVPNGFNYLDFSYYMLDTNADGHIGDVTNLFWISPMLVSPSRLQAHEGKLPDNLGGHTYTFYSLLPSEDPEEFETVIDRDYTDGTYKVKNNKCFCYPYNYLYVTNNSGSNNIYKYENFTSPDLRCHFNNEGAISIGGSIRLVPKDYKHIARYDDEALPLAKLPTCQWAADSYTNWLTQNSINGIISYLGIVDSAFNMIPGANAFNQNLGTSIKAGAVKENAGGLVMGGLSTGSSLIGLGQQCLGFYNQFKQAQLLPAIKSGEAQGDIAFTTYRNCFTFYKMRCKEEYLKKIDDYFTRFGYRMDRVIVPNLSGRPHWNYVEIGLGDSIGKSNPNMHPDFKISVPDNAMQIINNAYRQGATIWHNLEEIGNFDLDNRIV